MAVLVFGGREMRAKGAAAAIAMVLVACGSGPTSGGARVKLAFENASGGGMSAQSLHPLAIPTAPATQLAVRLAKVYLVADVDPATQDNVGAVAMIWQNARCDGPSSCDYFELGRPSAEVNAELASQPLDVKAGTYRYARLELCVGGPSGPNVRWRAGDMTEAHEFTSGMCGVTSARMDPPLTLADGDAVSVSLAYDLTEAAATGPTTPERADQKALDDTDGHGVGFDDCAPNAEKTQKTCVRVPAFTPTARRGP